MAPPAGLRAAENALHTIEEITIHQGRDALRVGNIFKLVETDIFFIPQQKVKRIIRERVPIGRADPVRIQSLADLMHRATLREFPEDPLDDRRRFRVDLISAIRPALVAERAASEHLTLQGAVIRPALDILRQVRGVILSERFHQAFKDDALRAVGDRLHDRIDLHPGLLQLVTIDCSIMAIPGEAVQLPNDQSLKRSGL